MDGHHRDGYATLYIDGHCRFLYDRTLYVRNYNNGSTYHSGKGGWTKQEQVYNTFFTD